MEYSNHLVDILSSIPTEYIELCHDIVQYAKQKLSIELDDSLYISLMDHITTSIERYNKGVILKNKLLWEIKHFIKTNMRLDYMELILLKKLWFDYG